jgi:hypothetical protein
VKAVGDIVDSRHCDLPNSAENAEKLLRATLLAEPFPGTVAQGVSLPKMQEMKALSFGQNQRAAQIRRLGAHWRKLWVATIFVAVEIRQYSDRSFSAMHLSHRNESG